jgi:hypothetical protein
MDGVSRKYSKELNREIPYKYISPDDWERELKKVGFPEHLTRYLVTMADVTYRL